MIRLLALLIVSAASVWSAVPTLIAQAEPVSVPVAPQVVINGPVVIDSGRVEVIEAEEPAAAITDTDCSDFSGLFPDVFDDQPENEWGTKDDACDPWPEIDERP